MDGLTAPGETGPGTQDALRAIWAEHRDELVGRIGVIERAVTSLIEGTLEESLRREAERAAHQLAGSLGTFGFPDGSERARRLELALEARAALGPAQVPELAALVLALEEELRADAEAGGGGVPAPGRPGALVISGDRELAGRLAGAARARGLHAESVASVLAARDAIARRAHDVVLLDLDLGEGRVVVHELLGELTRRRPAAPVLALTTGGGFEERVEAARRGAAGFLPASRPTAQVMDLVERAVSRSRADRSRVLAVDDDPVALAAVGAILGADRMEVTAVADPLRLGDALAEVDPELLVLDVDMPGADGIELCRVVRGDPRWSALPVVVLTARTDRETIERVFAAGADDYVAKPIVASELALRVGNRIERSRRLRERADVDVLTGAATHGAARGGLLQLARLAERFGEPLCVSFVALDGVEALRAASGQAAVDELLAALGRRLLKTFRGEDVVGRRDDAGFVVGMFGMSRQAGLQRMRDALSAFRDTAATASAGVVELPADAPGLAAAELAAEEALTRARQAGGDAVAGAGVPEADVVDVAVVEDDEAVAALLRHALDTAGHSMRWLARGDLAADALTGTPPRVQARLVLLDVDLPALDGLAVLRLLGASGVLQRTQVIMLTGRSAEAEVLQALELGASDHIAKPFSVPVLMQKVRRALEGLTPWRPGS